MYKLGTLEQYLVENPTPTSDSDSLQKRKWQNLKHENEYLWESDGGTIDENEKFNLVSVWTNSIIKPTSKKYYINKNGHYSCGVVDVGSVMESGLKNIQIFDDKSEWLALVDELGIEKEEV